MSIKKAKEIIDDILYLTIATVCPDGTPWKTPVYTAFDNDLNFYWGSWLDNQQSKNIENNENAFCTIYDGRGPEGTDEGVSFKGQLLALSSLLELTHALNALDMRAGKEKGNERPDPFIKGDPRKIYKFVPEICWMNDEGSKDGEYIDIRKK